MPAHRADQHEQAGDVDLMQSVQAGDKAAFETLFQRHRRRIRGRLMQLVHEEATAEDLLQEVFLRLWTKAEQWKGRGSPAGWLMQIASRLGLNELRSRQRRRTQPLEADWDDDDASPPEWLEDVSRPRPDEAADRAEQYDILRTQIDRLPARHREILLMIHEAGLDISDAAECLDIPPGTVKSRLFHARAGLRKIRDEAGD